MLLTHYAYGSHTPVSTLYMQVLYYSSDHDLLLCLTRASLQLHNVMHNNWGEPERAPPRALQRLRSLSHNDGNNDNNISYVLAPVYKRLYCIRDVTYISRAHALRANVKPAH